MFLPMIGFHHSLPITTVKQHGSVAIRSVGRSSAITCTVVLTSNDARLATNRQLLRYYKYT